MLQGPHWAPPKGPEHVKQTDQQTRTGLGALEQQLGLPSPPELRVLVPQGGDGSLLLSCRQHGLCPASALSLLGPLGWLSRGPWMSFCSSLRQTLRLPWRASSGLSSSTPAVSFSPRVSHSFSGLAPRPRGGPLWKGSEELQPAPFPRPLSKAHSSRHRNLWAQVVSCCRTSRSAPPLALRAPVPGYWDRERPAHL